MYDSGLVMKQKLSKLRVNTAQLMRHIRELKNGVEELKKIYREWQYMMKLIKQNANH